MCCFATLGGVGGGVGSQDLFSSLFFCFSWIISLASRKEVGSFCWGSAGWLVLSRALDGVEVWVPSQRRTQSSNPGSSRAALNASFDMLLTWLNASLFACPGPTSCGLCPCLLCPPPDAAPGGFLLEGTSFQMPCYRMRKMPLLSRELSLSFFFGFGICSCSARQNIFSPFPSERVAGLPFLFPFLFPRLRQRPSAPPCLRAIFGR